MDPIAHASIALLAKPVVPRAPLWALVAAAEVPDVLFFAFEAAGLEHQAVTRLDLSQGLTYISPPLIPWSHGLFMCFVWSVAVAAITWLFWRDGGMSAAAGLMVLSHWLLDFTVYPNMPLLFAGSPVIGLGLMTSGAGFIASIVLEIGLIGGGIFVYFKTRKPGKKP